jgi:hypothetical protein
MGFIFGLLIGIPAGAYLTYRYRAAIQDWLDMADD